jgi:hypothetical protein
LFALEHEQLGIDGEDFGDRIFELTPFGQPAFDVLDQLEGDMHNPLLTLGHESEGPYLVAFTATAAAGGFTAFASGGAQGTEQGIFWHAFEVAEGLELPLAKPGGDGTFWDLGHKNKPPFLL